MEEVKPQNSSILSSDDSSGNTDFRLIKIKPVKPEKFALADTLIVAAGLMILINFGIVKTYQYNSGLSLNEAILEFSNLWMLFFNLAGLVIFTLLFLRAACVVEIKDDNNIKPMLSFLSQSFGLKLVQKKGDFQIFKAENCKSSLGLKPKIKISINGNSVSLSGWWMCLQQVKKALKSYQK